mgnify:CR=1 FL=1
MIKVTRLKECKGSNKFGTCNSCGVGSDIDDTLIRITTMTDNRQGTSMCLCEKCKQLLLVELLSSQLEDNLDNRPQCCIDNGVDNPFMACDICEFMVCDDCDYKE